MKILLIQPNPFLSLRLIENLDREYLENIPENILFQDLYYSSSFY